MSTVEAMNEFEQYPHVRLVAAGNQSGTYFNGPLNNGVGATFTYATGALTIDSVTVAVGDFILLAGQSSAYQNGIYQCTQAGATGVAAILTRRGDFQCREQIRGGHYVVASAGTVYNGSIWAVVEPLPAAVGAPASGTANNINFVQNAAGGSSTFLQAANNLSDLSNVATALTNLGLGTIQQATVTLNPTQMAAAYATPAQLIAAPGAGKTIFVLSAYVYTNYQGTAFATGTAPIIQYNNTAHGAGTSAVASGLVAGDIDATASQVRNLFPLATGAQTGFTNQGIFFSNATGAYTGGTNGSVTFTLNYVTLTATI